MLNEADLEIVHHRDHHCYYCFVVNSYYDHLHDPNGGNYQLLTSDKVHDHYDQ